MLGVVFLCSQFSPIEIIVSNKFFIPTKDIDFLSSRFTRLFFLKFWGFENCQIGHALD